MKEEKIVKKELKACRNLRSAGLKGLATAVVALVILGFGPVAAAAVLVVNDDPAGNPAEPVPCDVTPDQSTIQDAITAAASGDHITICPGKYPEDLTITTDDLTLHCVNTKYHEAVIEGQATNVAADFPLASPNIGIQADKTTIANCKIKVPGGPGEYGSGIVLAGKNNAITQNDIRCEAGDPGTVCLQTWNSAALSSVPTDISGSFIGLNHWTCKRSGGAFGCEGLFINPQFDTEDFMSIVGNNFKGRFYRLIAVARPKVLVANNKGTTDLSPTNTPDFGMVPIGIKLFGAGDLFGALPGPGSNKANTTDSLVLENVITSRAKGGFFRRLFGGRGRFARGIWVEDRGADGAATANLLRENIVKGASEWDCLDETSGDRTAGTGNVWAEHDAQKDSPDGICP